MQGRQPEMFICSFIVSLNDIEFYDSNCSLNKCQLICLCGMFGHGESN